MLQKEISMVQTEGLAWNKFWFHNLIQLHNLLTRKGRVSAYTRKVVMGALMASKHTDGIGCLPVAIASKNFPTAPVLTDFAAHIMRVQFTNSKRNELIGITTT